MVVDSTLSGLFDPASVVVVGASADPAKWGHHYARSLLQVKVKEVDEADDVTREYLLWSPRRGTIYLDENEGRFAPFLRNVRSISACTSYSNALAATVRAASRCACTVMSAARPPHPMAVRWSGMT